MSKPYGYPALHTYLIRHKTDPTRYYVAEIHHNLAGFEPRHQPGLAPGRYRVFVDGVAVDHVVNTEAEAHRIIGDRWGSLADWEIRTVPKNRIVYP